MLALGKRIWDPVVIVLAGVLVKFVSLAFIRASVGGSIVSQLTTKWDSVFYISLAQYGYPAGVLKGIYAFAPLYPALIRFGSSVVGSYAQAAIVVSIIFSLLTPLVFYMTARMLLTQQEALYASLAFSVFPTFVTYGLVAYPEPVYLFFSILTVYAFLRGKMLSAGIAASLAALTNYVEILAPLMLLCVLGLRGLQGRYRTSKTGVAPTDAKDSGAKWRTRLSFLWLLLPFLVLGVWVNFLDAYSNHFLSVVAAQSFWGTTIANPIAQFQTFFTGVFSTQGNPIAMLTLRYCYTLPFFALAYPLWKIVKGLAVYSSVYMVLVLSLVGTAYMSGPRLMLLAWPIMLVFGKTKKEYLIPILLLFAIASLQSTYAQLTSFWT